MSDAASLCVARGIVIWEAHNPPESGLRFSNGLYDISGVSNNIALNGGFQLLNQFLSDPTTYGIAGSKLDELHLGDDVTAEARGDTGVKNSIGGITGMANADNLTPVLDVTVSTNDTIYLTANWTNGSGAPVNVGEVAIVTDGGTAFGRNVFQNPVLSLADAGTLSITYKLIRAPV